MIQRRRQRDGRSGQSIRRTARTTYTLGIVPSIVTIVAGALLFFMGGLVLVTVGAAIVVSGRLVRILYEDFGEMTRCAEQTIWLLRVHLLHEMHLCAPFILHGIRMII